MSKAYDRVSWLYLTKVLRKMEFAEIFIDIIWRLIANWYSILFTGQAHDFFHSTRSVKQGDPLSSALFILSTEVLFRALNRLLDNDRYQIFGLPKWSGKINHFAYADDTIIFTSAETESLHMTMNTLKEYEQMLCQPLPRDYRTPFPYWDFDASIWDIYYTVVGIRGPFVQIRQTVIKWWKKKEAQGKGFDQSCSCNYSVTDLKVEKYY
ncbi:uncharacterized protein LOC129883418 [Solanum dulcamara]|uniref:uncharacterized protein LOC129883418 n=1 Tax=Solanum dulcamara TaxID=45834 RepID=UPI002485A6F1|nr:uncharacterized protein LOC129883418 [Solanum dulcamara]